MTEKDHKPQWGLVLAAGLISIAFGVFFIVYAITVVARSRFPANSELYLINGFFFIGLGIGHLACARAIKNLEKKIRKLKEELHAQKTKAEY